MTVPSNKNISTPLLSEFQQRVIKKLERELGNDIMAALGDPDVIEIMLNSDGYLWIEKIGQPMQKLSLFSDSNARALMGTIASYYDTTVTPDNPILECELPIDGSRFEGLLPPVVAHTSFAIRKKAIKIFTLDDYYKKEILTKEQIKVIKDAISERKNILIVGGTGSGKTTLTNAIIDSMVDITPEHRILIIEDTAEIQCRAENAVILRATAFISMLRLLKAVMRLRPDRILVGEVRGKEALDLLKAWNTGHPGGIATVHANSAFGGLIRMEQLIAEGTAAPMQQLIAEAVNMVVFIEKTEKSRVVKEIISVNGFNPIAQEYITNKII
ncbi:MAG: P-type conjugative transfer ATPase TrbB [Bacilli bacterium]|nr:P-type conjugative transfer ATPase TrbB [Bacilli bacterium]